MNVLVYMIDIVRGEKIEVIDCLSVVKSMAKIILHHVMSKKLSIIMYASRRISSGPCQV